MTLHLIPTPNCSTGAVQEKISSISQELMGHQLVSLLEVKERNLEILPSIISKGLHFGEVFVYLIHPVMAQPVMRCFILFSGYRLLFWLDVGSVGQLKRSLLDGSNITTIISDLPNPTDLVVDVEADLVFWGDAEKHSIELATIDGRDR